MGLDTTHGAWHGSYSTFNEWRNLVARAAGFPPLKEMRGFGGERLWETTSGDRRLIPLLNHSDCDSYLSVRVLPGIAAGLDAIVDRLPAYLDEGPAFHELWRDRTRAFAAGCRAAAAAGEPIEFR